MRGFLRNLPDNVRRKFLPQSSLAAREEVRGSRVTHQSPFQAWPPALDSAEMFAALDRAVAASPSWGRPGDRAQGITVSSAPRREPQKPIVEASPPTNGNLSAAKAPNAAKAAVKLTYAPDPVVPDPDPVSYEPWFGLYEKPFSRSLEPRFFFFGKASHLDTFNTLLAAIYRREGIVVLAGKPGTGKTALCRAVVQSLSSTVFATMVADAVPSGEHLLTTLLVAFGVVSINAVRNGRLRDASRADLRTLLQKFLRSLQQFRAFALVIIDEAHTLPTEVLDEIRNLSDQSRREFMQIVLVGRPELQARLATPAMRQLGQRISLRCELEPLTRKDVGQYVAHRLAVAGDSGKLTVSDAALDLLSDSSGGIPQVINLLCDRALDRAAQARMMTLVGEHVRGALADLNLPESSPRSPSSNRPESNVPFEVAQKVAPKERLATLAQQLLDGLAQPIKHPPSLPKGFANHR